MVLASLLLCLSVFSPARSLGLLLAASFLLMAAGDVWFLRGLLARREERGVAIRRAPGSL